MVKHQDNEKEAGGDPEDRPAVAQNGWPEENERGQPAEAKGAERRPKTVLEEQLVR
jgi:hypothetical protein